MKILIVHRYFYPDSPTYAFLLYKLAMNFKEYFKEVSVLTSMPSYYGSSKLKNIPSSENLNGIQVRRLRLLPEHNRSLFWRFLNSLLFAFSVFFHLLLKGNRYDVVQVATTPPIMSALAVTFASKIRRFKFLYHCQDIYPDITTIGNENDSEGWTFRFMFFLDKFIMRSAWKIVVLSDDMKQHIVQKRKLEPGKVEVINNFDFNRVKSDKGSRAELPESLKYIIEAKERTIIFAGNLGYFQNLDLVFKAVSSIVAKNNITFLIVGDGVKKKELEEKYSHRRIVFTGFLSNETLQIIYPYCQLGLAPVVEGIERVAYPSKIISYTVAGLPILTFSSKKSSIAGFVKNNVLGENYGFEGEQVLEELILKAIFKKFDRDRIKNIASIEFGEQTAFNKWKEIYQTVEAN